MRTGTGGSASGNSKPMRATITATSSLVSTSTGAARRSYLVVMAVWLVRCNYLGRKQLALAIIYVYAGRDGRKALLFIVLLGTAVDAIELL